MAPQELDAKQVRMDLLLADEALLEAVMGGGAFGGSFSPNVAQNMFDQTNATAIADAKNLVEVVEVCPRSWLVRLPIVNCAVFETDDGLVVVDTGMAPGGPAVLQAIRNVTQAQIHTIIYTHAHVDHCMGTWALMDDSPTVIAHEDAPERFARYVKLRGSVSRYMSQPLDTFPSSEDDWVAPTQTFSDRLSITVGGERFDLVHRRAETDDQLYVSVPSRRAIASADYFQGFLPNAGNGKRVQRYVEEWASALREMVALDPQYLLPAHGEPMSGEPQIAEVLTVHAEALESIVTQTLEGLNAQRRQDEVFNDVALPAHLAGHSALNEQYVSPADISRMIIKQYCGWWDDVPSHWSPARFDRQAATWCRLLGGSEAVVTAALEMSSSDPQMACHLVDFAYFADESDLTAAEATIEVYRTRVLNGGCNTQEALMYLDHMTEARMRVLAAASQ